MNTLAESSKDPQISCEGSNDASKTLTTLTTIGLASCFLDLLVVTECTSPTSRFFFFRNLETYPRLIIIVTQKLPSFYQESLLASPALSAQMKGGLKEGCELTCAGDVLHINEAGLYEVWARLADRFSCIT